MRKDTLVVSSFMVLALLLTMAVAAMAVEPIVGTWKLNVAKSKLPPSQQAPTKEQTITIKELGDQLEVTNAGTRTDGSSIASKHTVPISGGAVKYEQGGPGEGISLVQTVIDPYNSFITILQNGKQVQIIQAVISKDGKTSRWTTKGTNAQGKPVEGIQVFEKQ